MNVHCSTTFCDKDDQVQLTQFLGGLVDVGLEANAIISTLLSITCTAESIDRIEWPKIEDR